MPKYKEPPGGGQLTEAEKRDGTVNLLWKQHNLIRDGSDLDAWAVGAKALAAQWGVRLVYSTNAATAGSQLPTFNSRMCHRDDVCCVTYWTWGNQAVPVSSLVPVREQCDCTVPATSTLGTTTLLPAASAAPDVPATNGPVGRRRIPSLFYIAGLSCLVAIVGFLIRRWLSSVPHAN